MSRRLIVIGLITMFCSGCANEARDVAVTIHEKAHGMTLEEALLWIAFMIGVHAFATLIS